MAIKQLKRIFLNSNDELSISDIVRSINILQENVAASLNPLASKVQNDSSFLSNISLTANQVNKINHRLGRKLLGYNVMLKVPADTASNITISNDQDNNPSPNLTLWLWTNRDCVVDLNVF